MIDFYTFPTSNGQRVGIMLEERGLPWRPGKITAGGALPGRP